MNNRFEDTRQEIIKLLEDIEDTYVLNFIKSFINGLIRNK